MQSSSVILVFAPCLASKSSWTCALHHLHNFSIMLCSQPIMPMLCNHLRCVIMPGVIFNNQMLKIFIAVSEVIFFTISNIFPSYSLVLSAIHSVELQGCKSAAVKLEVSLNIKWCRVWLLDTSSFILQNKDYFIQEWES